MSTKEIALQETSQMNNRLMIVNIIWQLNFTDRWWVPLDRDT